MLPRQICCANTGKKNSAFSVFPVENDVTFGDFNRNSSTDSKINSVRADARDSHRILQEVSHA